MEFHSSLQEKTKSGMVDVRTRDSERVGKMRVDEVANYFRSLLPKPSSKFESKYSKAWNPKDYPE